MMMKSSAASSDGLGNRATATQASSRAEGSRAGYITVFAAWGLVLLAVGWGLYESVELLTGVMPKF
jgi:hypothetical protein